MLRRHIDVFAIFFIALGFVAFSQASSQMRLPIVMDSFRLHNAVSVDKCPVRDKVLAHLSSLLNR